MNTSTRSDYKREIAEQLTRSFLRVCVVGFPLVAAVVVCGFLVPVIFPQELVHKFVVSRLTFLSSCLVVAIFELFLGVLLALVGVTADYDVDAAVGPAKMRLVSASPGILLILCANMLLALCIFRSLALTQSTLQEDSAPASPAAAGDRDVDVPPLESPTGPK